MSSVSGDSDSSRTLIDEPVEATIQLPLAPPGYDPTPASPMRHVDAAAPVSPVRPSPQRQSMPSPLSDSEFRDVPILPLLRSSPVRSSPVRASSVRSSPVRHQLRPCDVLYNWNPYTSLWHSRRQCTREQQVFLDQLDTLFREVIPAEWYHTYIIDDFFSLFSFFCSWV